MIRASRLRLLLTHSLAMPRTGIKRAREVIGHTGPLGWKLIEPISFVESRSHPAVQLADVVAGTAVWLLSNKSPQGFQGVAEKIQDHTLEDSILSDFEVLDISQRQTAVNWLILLSHKRVVSEVGFRQ